jgi:hypothetical protein
VVALPMSPSRSAVTWSSSSRSGAAAVSALAASTMAEDSSVTPTALLAVIKCLCGGEGPSSVRASA